MNESECNECKNLTIPTHLHRKGRPVNNDYDEGELIYRRFAIEGESWGDDKEKSVKVFPIKNDSCNRSKFCSDPTDVLYNIDSDTHFTNYGIISIGIDTIHQFNRSCKVREEEKTFTMSVQHSPEECMYPHCELIIFVDGEVAPDKPKSIKAAFRNLLIDAIKIEKPFSSSHNIV